jgi:hypothetical protein
MVNSNDWILIQYGKPKLGSLSDWIPPKEKLTKIEAQIFKESLKNSIYYAFFSFPYTNVNIKSGHKDVGLALRKQYENIIKGRLIEDIIISMLSKNSDLCLTNYLSEHPDQTPYWQEDICDAVRISKISNEIISEVDVKALYVKWNVNSFPSFDIIKKTMLVRKSFAPKTAKPIESALIMLLEAPWRHFYKLLTQYKDKRGYQAENPDSQMEIPHENLCVLCPRFNINKFAKIRDLDKLLENYYYYWQRSKKKETEFIPIRSKLPKILDFFTRKKQKYPESIKWLIKNWGDIDYLLKELIRFLLYHLQGFWSWIFGFINQKSAQHFEKVYQRDVIICGSKIIWASTAWSPNDQAWRKYLQAKKGGKNPKKPEIDDRHPDLNLNNHTININSPFVYSVKDFL